MAGTLRENVCCLGYGQPVGHSCSLYAYSVPKALACGLPSHLSVTTRGTQRGWEPHSSAGFVGGTLTPRCCGVANLMPHHLMLEVPEKWIFLLFTKVLWVRMGTCDFLKTSTIKKNHWNSVIGILFDLKCYWKILDSMVIVVLFYSVWWDLKCCCQLRSFSKDLCRS